MIVGGVIVDIATIMIMVAIATAHLNNEISNKKCGTELKRNLVLVSVTPRLTVNPELGQADYQATVSKLNRQQAQVLVAATNLESNVQPQVTQIVRALETVAAPHHVALVAENNRNHVNGTITTINYPT